MWLGLDAGASALKWCAVDANGVVAHGRLDPLTGHLYDGEARDAALASLRSVAAELATAPQGVVIGVPGLNNKDILEQMLTEAFTTSNVSVITDSELAYRANLEPGEGVVVYSGTGSVLIHITADNEIIQVGGRGYLLGDEGGGYWIGKEAIRHLVIHFDKGTDPQTDPFAAAILRECGATTWREVIPFVYGGDRSQVAALTRIVREFCDAGNLDAIDIVFRAVGLLADQFHILQARIGTSSPRVVIAGGGFEAHAQMDKMFSAEIGLPVNTGRRDAAEGAANLSRHTFA